MRIVDEVTLRFFRVSLGLSLMIAFFLRVPDLTFLFSGQGMMDRTQTFFFHFTILFFWDHPIWPWILGACYLYLLVKFTRGNLSRLGYWVMLVLQLSFHNANPLIIHEPEQVFNFLLVSFLFLPLKDGVAPQRSVGLLLTGFLGAYYFVAGLKKLPDPNWWSGDALKYYLQWSALSRESVFTQWLVNSGLTKFLTYAVLVYEMTFFIVSWTRFRAPLYIALVTFHFAIWLCMDVGTFGFAMATWGTLLFDQETREDLKRFIKKLLPERLTPSPSTLAKIQKAIFDHQ